MPVYSRIESYILPIQMEFEVDFFFFVGSKPDRTWENTQLEFPSGSPDLLLLSLTCVCAVFIPFGRMEWVEHEIGSRYVITTTIISQFQTTWFQLGWRGRRDEPFKLRKLPRLHSHCGLNTLHFQWYSGLLLLSNLDTTSSELNSMRLGSVRTFPIATLQQQS